MDQSTCASPCDQLHSVRDHLTRQTGLSFLDTLSRTSVESACRSLGHVWRRRIYTPWVTLNLFLAQILSDDQSCDDAVDRFQEFRYDNGLPAVALETGSYCDARQRLPEPIFWDLVRRTGQSIHDKAKASWLFHGRSVKIVDGTTVVMLDTQENQKAYPQTEAQAPGLGFPIARVFVIFSLAVGTVLDSAAGPYQGNETSELALFREIIDGFRAGDIVLVDRFYCSFWLIAALRAGGVDVLVRLHQRRSADFRKGRKLGRHDHVVTWPKPKQAAKWMCREMYDAMPAELTDRELRIRNKDKTKRIRDLIIMKTLTDHTTYYADELRGLYRQRWNAELDLRSLKIDMHMEMLITKTPEMARKEIATHFLAYNLIRGIIAEAARTEKVKPRGLSFKGALHTIRSFEETHLYNASRIVADLPRLLNLIGKKRVGDRPNRNEPRAVKRRPKPHPLLNMTRAEAKRLIRMCVTFYANHKLID